MANSEFLDPSDSDFMKAKSFFRRKRRDEDEKIIEQMLQDLKAKHEKEREEQLKGLQQQLQHLKR